MEAKNAGCHSANTKYVRMYRIKSVELIEKKKPDFDLDVVDEYKYYHDRNTPKLDWNEKQKLGGNEGNLTKQTLKKCTMMYHLKILMFSASSVDVDCIIRFKMRE